MQTQVALLFLNTLYSNPSLPTCVAASGSCPGGQPAGNNADTDCAAVPQRCASEPPTCLTQPLTRLPLLPTQVVVQEGNLQATMQTHVALLSPSLVVLGSEVIAKEQVTTGVQLTGGAAAAAGASQSSSR